MRGIFTKQNFIYANETLKKWIVLLFIENKKFISLHLFVTMTNEESKEIVQILKNGKIFKDTETIQGFIEIYYNEEDDEFVKYAEIVSDDLYNPETEIKNFSENQFRKFLEKNYDYDFFISNLYDA